MVFFCRPENKIENPILVYYNSGTQHQIHIKLFPTQKYISLIRMAGAIKVFTDVEALAAVTADPKNVLSLTVKLDPKTKLPAEYMGTMFLYAKYKINGMTNDGWFRITQDIPLARGVADPTNTADSRNKFAGTRNQLEMNLSQSGHVGQFLHKLNPVWNEKIEELNTAGTVIKAKREVHQLLQYKLSADRAKDANKEIEDPVLRFQIEPGTFSDKYPYVFLRGQKKTVFLDARTEYKGPDGQPQYKEAMITDENGKEVPVTIENMHKFITSGSVLKAGSRIMMPSAARSSAWISLPIVINKAIIMPRPPVIGFSDELPANFNAVKEAIQASNEAVDNAETPTDAMPTTDAVSSVDVTPVQEQPQPAPSADVTITQEQPQPVPTVADMQNITNALSMI